MSSLEYGTKAEDQKYQNLSYRLYGQKAGGLRS